MHTVKQKAVNPTAVASTPHHRLSVRVEEDVAVECLRDVGDLAKPGVAKPAKAKPVAKPAKAKPVAKPAVGKAALSKAAVAKEPQGEAPQGEAPLGEASQAKAPVAESMRSRLRPRKQN